jgi:hypothetical protein
MHRTAIDGEANLLGNRVLLKKYLRRSSSSGVEKSYEKEGIAGSATISTKAGQTDEEG